jgi:hypothetical protein
MYCCPKNETSCNVGELYGYPPGKHIKSFTSLLQPGEGRAVINRVCTVYVSRRKHGTRTTQYQCIRRFAMHYNV